MILLKKTFPIILLLLSHTVLAATLIEVVEDGERSQVMIDGNKSRINMGEGQGFMLIDYKKQTMFAVMPKEKQILDMSGDLPSLGGSPVAEIKTVLVSNGRGPTIAGFPTKKFTLKAEGKVCGTLFGSKAAMQTIGLNRLFESMKAMAEKQRTAMGRYAALVDVCTRADMSFASQVEKVGVPMRTLDANGKITSEIKSIKTNVRLPANTFTLPQGYEIITLAEQMDRARQGLNQLQGQMPDMQQMMKQMQESGGMPPEVMQQMKRYQEMLQQKDR